MVADNTCFWSEGAPRHLQVADNTCFWIEGVPDFTSSRKHIILDSMRARHLQVADNSCFWTEGVPDIYR